MSDALFQLLTKNPIVPVVTLERSEDGVPLAEALLAGGISVIEITLRTKAGLLAIAEVAQKVPNMCVGAGTITSPTQFKQAESGGAQFIVSPGLTATLAAGVKGAKTPLLPGVSTTTEIMHARECGYTFLKFFPASLAGGVPALKQYSGLFSDVRFCPTGGINASNAKDYLALKSVVCVGGSWVAPDNLIREQNWKEITRLTKEALALIRA